MFKPEDFEYDSMSMQQNIPDSFSSQEIPPAQNEQYGDFILKYPEYIWKEYTERPDAIIQPVNDMFGVIYIPLEQVTPLEVNSYTYASIPKCYTFMDTEAMNAAGISRLQNHPFLKLQGEGTVIAVIDSGIDYTNPVFMEGDVSRIAYIWDQTIIGNEDDRVPYGRVFTNNDINRALKSENPLEIVPSTDELGHGSALAGLAAGNLVPEENFSGAAPKATIIAVKLKGAKSYLREFYQLPPDALAFQENDIMLGIAFAIKMANSLGMPISVCLGLGTSQGAHIGDSELSRYLNYVNENTQVSVSVAAGNEGIAQHHFTAELSKDQTEETAELRVAEGEQGFYMEFWGNTPDDYSVSIQSPTGETLYVSTSLGAGTQQLSFIFTETKVLVNYVGMERMTGKQLIYFRFLHPAAGIWKINVGNQKGAGSRFHMWLPVQGFISPDTYFLQSNPYSTVTAPGDSAGSITATAYKYRDNSLYFQAGRGFTPDNQVTPDLAAPGVDLTIPLPGGGFGKASGSSLSAAITAGAAALMLEWSIVRGNVPYASGNSVKYSLQKGAIREENMFYPNPDWGYGRLNLYHTFEVLS
ncbi:MAG: S8 family peptidase [Clostridia bacterium]|nr:S8 family peptidase [Clostridia bacterium]MDY5555618.1 S8 family peptidase [Blautia sp.]